MYIIAVDEVEYKSQFESTKDTPYLNYAVQWVFLSRFWRKLIVPQQHRAINDVPQFRASTVNGFLFSGPNPSSHLLATICGTEIPNPIYIHGDVAYLRFHSDNQRQGAGFTLQYGEVSYDTGEEDSGSRKKTGL